MVIRGNIPVVIILVFGITFICPSLGSGVCIPFEQARNHIGETQCVTGKVLRTEVCAKGVRYLDFCEDYRLCSFSVVVFPHDLKDVGDVQQLAARHSRSEAS